MCVQFCKCCTDSTRCSRDKHKAGSIFCIKPTLCHRAAGKAAANLLASLARPFLRVYICIIGWQLHITRDIKWWEFKGARQKFTQYLSERQFFEQTEFVRSLELWENPVNQPLSHVMYTCQLHGCKIKLIGLPHREIVILSVLKFHESLECQL